MKSVKCLKTFVIFLLAFSIMSAHAFCSSASSHKVYYNGHKYRYVGKKYKVFFNGKSISSSKRPAMKVNDNIMIPYSYSLVRRGPKVKMAKNYSKGVRALTLSRGNHKVTLIINKKYFYANGIKQSLNTQPFYAEYKGKKYIMIPGKAVLPELGLNYNYSRWDSAVYITEKVSAATPAVQKNNNKSLAVKTPVVKQPVNTDLKVSSSVANLKATRFKGLTTTQFINLLAPIARDDYKHSGILPSVTLAQAILESGWGKSYLAQKANNIFGMKAVISGNNWIGTTWDGKSYIRLLSGEEYGGKKVKVNSNFRKYNTVYLSIRDHSAYLRYARNGSSYGYAGIAQTKSFSKQIAIIRKGGYATSSNYASSLISLIRRYNLSRFDK